MDIKELKGKKVLILGLGKEGRDTLEFLFCLSHKSIGIADKREDIVPIEGVELHLGRDYLKSIKRYDIVIKSPGIPMSTIAPYLRKDLFITSQADLFLDNAKGRVIGITGTKGKSTISSLIHEILLKKGINATLIGNIGEPALKYLVNDKPDKVYVYELSSFQLETVKKSPQIAVILNLYKDHLDHHNNMEEYGNAKFKITKFQTKDDILIFNKADPVVKSMAEKSKAIKMPFNPNRDPLGIRKDITIPIEALLHIAKIFDISKNDILEVIKSFTPLPHRLKYVGEYRGIRFYNDSAATIPEAAISAIDKIGDDLDTIITGGVDKGFDLRKLAKRISNSPIRNLILFPETGEKIAKVVVRRIKIFHTKNMEEAVSISFRVTKKGKVCLLAPAASSFNIFKSYKERGDLFEKYIKNEKIQH